MVSNHRQGNRRLREGMKSVQLGSKKLQRLSQQLILWLHNSELLKVSLFDNSVRPRQHSLQNRQADLRLVFEIDKQLTLDRLLWEDLPESRGYPLAQLHRP